ncbi:MAG: hypothetical protein VSS75_020135 [Candidatus Parabeggiatoa sp.]|nr:hypothetical protein [Candidatus Parabeggiatoa sp.]
MLNFYKKLSLVVLSGALTLGLSSVANANIMMSWIPADKKLDCPMTCRANSVIPYPMFAGIDKNNKPISLCTTKDKKSREWLLGNNRWEQKTCTVAIGDKIVHSDRYYCLCHNNRHIQPLG